MYFLYYSFPQQEDRLTPVSNMKLRSTSGRNLSVEQEELINRLVYFQDEFEQPSDDDLKRLTVRNYIISI